MKRGVEDLSFVNILWGEMENLMITNHVSSVTAEPRWGLSHPRSLRKGSCCRSRSRNLATKLSRSWDEASPPSPYSQGTAALLERRRKEAGPASPRDVLPCARREPAHVLETLSQRLLWDGGERLPYTCQEHRPVSICLGLQGRGQLWWANVGHAGGRTVLRCSLPAPCRAVPSSRIAPGL